MATAKYIQTGKMIDYTPSSAVSGGDVVVQGDMVGVAYEDIAASALGSLIVDGVVEFPKAASDGGISVGVLGYWDVAEQVVKADSENGANKTAGVLIATAATAATTARVKMLHSTMKALAHIADTAAMTAAAAALTGSDPAAQSAVDPTLAANDVDDQSGGTPSVAHQIVDCATDTWDNEKADVENNFSTLGAEYNELKDDTEFLETALEATIDDVAELRAHMVLNVADLVTQKAKLDALITDVTAIRTKQLAVLAQLEAAGVSLTS